MNTYEAITEPQLPFENPGVFQVTRNIKLNIASEFRKSKNEFLRRSTHVAEKEHECCFCLSPITVWSTYEKFIFAVNNWIFEQKFHYPCCDGPDDEREHILEDFEEDMSDIEHQEAA